MPETLDSHPAWGMEFDWPAIDRDGRVAVFSSGGYGPVPSEFIRVDRAVDAALDLVRGLPGLGRSRRTPASGPGDNSSWFELGARGFYVYDWPTHHGPYQLICTPSRPLHVSDLPTEVADLARLASFPAAFPDLAHVLLPYMPPTSR